MALTLADVLVTVDAEGTLRPAAGTVTATPTLLPLFIEDGGVWYETQPPIVRSVVADLSTGAWSIVLPWPSECDPSTIEWKVRLPDGFEWQGLVPEGVAGPVTIHELKNTYSWALVTPSVIGTVAAIQGPPSGILTGDPDSGGPGFRMLIVPN